MKNITISKNLALAFLAVILVSLLVVSRVGASATTINTTGLLFNVGSSSQETVSSSVSTTILATSTGRTWAKFSNNSSNAIYCTYGNPAAQAQGFLVLASSTYEMNQLTSPVYVGSVNCIATTSSATIWVEANPS